MAFSHVPVLLAETVDALRIREDGCYVDGTLGGTGHASEIVRRLTAQGSFFGFDKDITAVEGARERLRDSAAQTVLFHDGFEKAVRILKENGVTGADGIVLDLGMSSMQIDDASRGFSYMADGPLDMRMDGRTARSAADIVNESDEETLKRIFRDYGEERFAAQIASRIVEMRKTHPIETTFMLNEAVYAAVPRKARTTGSHPSKRVFQALRIACNAELEALEEALSQMIPFLHPGGRIAVITFHSLEDRIVKSRFREAESPCTCPPSFPVCVCGKTPLGKTLNRKGVLPSAEETARNPRAKSAKLRVFERNGRA